MAIGRRRRTPQQELFVATSDIRALDNPFYRALNGLLEEHGFDEFAEEQCREFYAGNRGRPGVPPGVYFRMLMVGYLEGLGSERGIAWRCADSFSLREFLGCGLSKNPPEHSTLSKTRKRLSVEAHGAVFAFVLERLMESGLLSGKTLGVDATTLEANAAMRTIVRREDGTEYEEFLEQLAVASGIETPTRDDLAKLDRKRPGKGSNKDWVHPHDPEARITKMKDGRTRLAHKLEQAVDMETGAVVATTVQTMDGGDTASLGVTLDEAERRLEEVGVEAQEVVADKGYHSNRTMTGVKERGKRSYVSEPDRGRRKWKGKRDAQKAVYANRRRIRGNRGKRLLRRRGERVERAFAHMLGTGGLRRVHVRGQEEIRKRMLVQAAAFNLGLLMRRRCGFGTPRALQGLAWAQAELAAHVAAATSAFLRHSGPLFRLLSAISAVTAANSGRRRPKPVFPHNPGRLCTAFVTRKRLSPGALLSTDCYAPLGKGSRVAGVGAPAFVERSGRRPCASSSKRVSPGWEPRPSLSGAGRHGMRRRSQVSPGWEPRPSLSVPRLISSSGCGSEVSPSIGGSCHTRKGFFKFADQVVPPPAPFPLHREWTRERAPFHGEGARLSITD